MKYLMGKLLLVCLLTWTGSAMSDFQENRGIWKRDTVQEYDALRIRFEQRGYFTGELVSIDGLNEVAFHQAGKQNLLKDVPEGYRTDYKSYGVLFAVRNGLVGTDGKVPSRITWDRFISIAKGDGWQMPVIPSRGVLAQLRTLDFTAETLAEKADSGEDVSAETAGLEKNLASIEAEYGSNPAVAAAIKAQRLRLDAIDKDAKKQAKFNAEIERSLRDLKISIKTFTGMKGEVDALSGKFGDLEGKQAATDVTIQGLGSEVGEVAKKHMVLSRAQLASTKRLNVSIAAGATNSELIETIKDDSAASDKRLTSLEKVAMWSLIGLVLLGILMMFFGWRRRDRFSAIENKQKATDATLLSFGLDIQRLKANQKEPETDDVEAEAGADDESSGTVFILPSLEVSVPEDQEFDVPEFLKRG